MSPSESDEAGALGTLRAKTRALTQAESRSAVGQHVADAARDLLGAPEAAVFLWDDQECCLRALAATDEAAAAAETPKLSEGDGLAWNVFVEGETRRLEDADGDDRESASALGSELVVPVGNHGVLVAGSPESTTFDDADVEFAEILAANAEAALDRTQREAALREQEARLRDQNRRLTRLDQVNATIRGVQGALVEADTRADIQAAVCRELAAFPHVEFAWIGHRSASRDALHVDAWSGDGRGFLDYLLGEQGDRQPLPHRVLDDGEPVTVDSIATSDAFEPWREPALHRGFRSVACHPLSWKDHDYGFLEVYGSRTPLFEDGLAVFSELAANVANAINAVERKEALISGQSTELELRVVAADDPLFELAARAESRVEVDGVVPRSGGSWLVHLVVREDDPAALVEACDSFVSIEDVEVVRSEEGFTLLALTLSEFTLVEVLGNHGATIQSVEVEPDGGTVVATVPASADIREFVESCERRLGEASLKRREPTGDTGSMSDLRYDLEDVVTDKQFDALRAGFFNGYFEVPREHTGQEVAEMLDVSGPTYQHHVRRGIRRILDVAFEGGTGK